MRSGIAVYVLCVLLVCAVIAAPKARTPQDCDPFIPRVGCLVNINFTIGVQQEVAVPPGGAATVHLFNKPPFTTCSVAASPAPLARDITSALGGFLSTLGSLGFLGGGPPAPKDFQLLAIQPGPPPPTPPNVDAQQIENQYQVVFTDEASVKQKLDAFSVTYKNVKDKIDGLWKQTDETKIATGVPPLRDLLSARINAGLPDIASIQVEVHALNRSMESFHQKYDGLPEVRGWINYINPKIDDVNGVSGRYQDYVTDLINARAAFKQALTELNTSTPPYTTQDMPLLKFVDKQVTETVSCKDDITNNPISDNIIFTAYYTRLPILDLSAGPLVSLLGRHQVGVVGQTAAQFAAGINPNGVFGVTDSSRVQVIPMAFAEIHTRGFACPWSDPKDQERRWGHVCSLGIALGVGPNNASGSTQAEFFEGLSFAIQRVSFIFGFHDGRVEQIGGGFAVGQPLPSAGYAPLITRAWSVHPGFGITYRIPLH